MHFFSRYNPPHLKDSAKYEGFVHVVMEWFDMANQRFFWFMDVLASDWDMHRAYYYFLWFVGLLQLVSFGSDKMLDFEVRYNRPSPVFSPQAISHCAIKSQY